MEWKKILINRKLTAVLILLFAVQMFVFADQVRKNDGAWEERTGQTYDEYLKEQELQHITGYPAKVQAVMEQAEAMDGISIFAQRNSFSQRNVAQTKKAFEPLLDLELTYVKGRTVTEFFSFRFGGLCASVCGLMIAFALSEVTQKNIRRLTYPTEFGRLRLALEKLCALFLWAFAVTFLFQMGVFIEGLVLFRENPLSFLFCPAQTFARFADFPLKITVWQALFLFMLYRTVILYVIMTAVWALALLFDHMVLAGGTLGGFMAAEYFLYRNIDGNHVLKLLKYCNLWYETVESEYFTDYRNLNILEYAVDRNAVIMTTLAGVYFVSAAAGVIVSCKRYPCSSKVSRFQSALHKVKSGLERVQGRFLEKRSLTGMECYKTLVSQKGLAAILLLSLLLCYRADFTQIRRTTQQELYDSFMEEYEGEPGEASDQAVARTAEKLEQVELTFAQQYSEAEDADTRIVLSMWYSSFEEERLFLQQIQEQTEYLKKKRQESGIDVWYVNLRGYDHLLQDDDAILNLGMLIAMLWICTAAYLSESGSGMACMMNSCFREKALYRTKLRLATFIASLIYTAVRVYEVLSVAAVYGIKGIGAPVQSIPALSHICVHCTIWQYFLFRYVGVCLFFLAICAGTCKALETIICKKGFRHGIKNRKSV